MEFQWNIQDRRVINWFIHQTFSMSDPLQYTCYTNSHLVTSLNIISQRKICVFRVLCFISQVFSCIMRNWRAVHGGCHETLLLKDTYRRHLQVCYEETVSSFWKWHYQPDPVTDEGLTRWFQTVITFTISLVIQLNTYVELTCPRGYLAFVQ